jgi:hypothetical protein
LLNPQIAEQFLFGDPLVTDAWNRFEQPTFNEPKHGFVVNLQQAGHFISGVYFHCLTCVLGVAAPHQPGTKPPTRLFSVRSFKKTDLAEMRSPGQWLAGLLEKTVLVSFVDQARRKLIFMVRVLLI